MTTTQNTIASVIASLQSLDAAVASVKSFGFPIDVVIVPAQGAATTVQQFQSAVAASSPVVAEVAEVPAPAVEAAPVTISPEARLASLVGTTIKVSHVGRRTSSGYKVDNASGNVTLTIGAKGSDAARQPVGYINVYAKTIGRDIHKTAAKAQRYGNDKVIDQLPVFSN